MREKEKKSFENNVINFAYFHPRLSFQRNLVFFESLSDL